GWRGSQHFLGQNAQRKYDTGSGHLGRSTPEGPPSPQPGSNSTGAKVGRGRWGPRTAPCRNGWRFCACAGRAADARGAWAGGGGYTGYERYLISRRALLCLHCTEKFLLRDLTQNG